MLFKESTQEQTEVLDEVLLVIFPVGIGQPNVGVQRQHLNRLELKFILESQTEQRVSVALSDVTG